MDEVTVEYFDNGGWQVSCTCGMLIAGNRFSTAENAAAWHLEEHGQSA